MMTEDKYKWYAAAEIWEREFVFEYGDRYSIIINPAKEINKYSIDLFCLRTSILADLKPMFAPFYKGQEMYGINPIYCWTFNVSDLIDYAYSHDDRLGIFIWVKFAESEMFNIKVESTESIYFTTLGQLKDYIKENHIIHKYGKRINDMANERESFIINLQDKIFRKIK
jgi:hypothetical protein